MYSAKEINCMKCKYVVRTDEYHGWECSITEGACMFLIPDQDACADKYGEVEHTNNYNERMEKKNERKNERNI